MTRNAERFNLGKLEVLITTSLLGIHSLMFPSYMRKEQVLVWGLLAGGILICPWGIASIRSWRVTNKEVASMEIKDTIEEVLASVEVEEPIEEVLATAEAEEPIEEVIASIEVKDIIEEVAWFSDVVAHEVEEFSLEEIVEKGFQAKEEGNFHRAAEWFLCALDRKPSYDIAFYLIIESYQHWKNGYSTKEALNKVRPHINEYLKDAPPEWSIKLTAWVQKEKVTNEL